MAGAGEWIANQLRAQRFPGWVKWSAPPPDASRLLSLLIGVGDGLGSCIPVAPAERKHLVRGLQQCVAFANSRSPDGARDNAQSANLRNRGLPRRPLVHDPCRPRDTMHTGCFVSMVGQGHPSSR